MNSTTTISSRVMTSEEIKEWRDRNGYSQRSLAAVLGVTSTAVSHWEIGHRRVPQWLWLALLGITAQQSSSTSSRCK